jgi:signal peptidase II
MRRREFVSLFSGTIASWPLAVNAQQPATPVIGCSIFAGPIATLLFAAVLSAVLDQTTKALALSYFSCEGRISVGGRIIRPVKNRRMMAGLISNSALLIVLWVAETGLVLGLADFGILSGRIGQAALGAALGGATSNLLDYLWRGAVIDFIDFRFWPAFNLADAAIVIGAAVAALSTV